MRTLVFGFACLFALNLQAQLTKPAHKVQLYSGDVISGERVTYEAPAMKPAFFILDTENYESSNVEFFQNNHGYFANLGRIYGMNKERYALRIRTGKLNLYEEIDMAVYGGDDLRTESSGNPQDPMLATGTTYQYYSKDDGAVRKASYHNLKVDLADNTRSVAQLKHYRNYRLLQWGLLGIGSGVIAASIIGQSGGPVKFNPVMALGFVIGGSSYFMETPKQDALWLAADEYVKAPDEVLSEN